MTKEKLSSLISHILALFLTFTLFGVTVCALLLCTVANPKMLDDAIREDELLNFKAMLPGVLSVYILFTEFVLNVTPPSATEAFALVLLA